MDIFSRNILHALLLALALAACANEGLAGCVSAISKDRGDKYNLTYPVVEIFDAQCTTPTEWCHYRYILGEGGQRGPGKASMICGFTMGDTNLLFCKRTSSRDIDPLKGYKPVLYMDAPYWTEMGYAEQCERVPRTRHETPEPAKADPVYPSYDVPVALEGQPMPLVAGQYPMQGAEIAYSARQTLEQVQLEFQNGSVAAIAVVLARGPKGNAIPNYLSNAPSAGGDGNTPLADTRGQNGSLPNTASSNAESGGFRPGLVPALSQAGPSITRFGRMPEQSIGPGIVATAQATGSAPLALSGQTAADILAEPELHTGMAVVVSSGGFVRAQGTTTSRGGREIASAAVADAPPRKSIFELVSRGYSKIERMQMTAQ